MMEWSYLLFFVLLASNSVTAIIPSNPKITDAPTNLHLQKREPWPDNVLLMVPEHVDERFFSIDGNGNTQGIVDHFSTVTVTESRRGVESVSRTHTARVGIHTTGVGKDGTQYAFEVAPAIREIIKNAYHSVAKRDLDSSADITIRQLSNIRVPDPALVRPAVAVANALNAEAGPSLIGVATEGATLAEVASAGALPAVEGASTVLLGATVVPYVALIAWVSFAWVGILQALSKTPQLDLPHAVVIDLSRLPNSDQCSGSPPSCDAETCKGLNSICTVGPACTFTPIC
jgi:hypothetical protein